MLVTVVLRRSKPPGRYQGRTETPGKIERCFGDVLPERSSQVLKFSVRASDEIHETPRQNAVPLHDLPGTPWGWARGMDDGKFPA